MREKLGPRSFGKKEELVFLGREISEQKNYSDKIAEEIDEEVHNIIDSNYNKAKDILQNKRKKLDEIAERLISKESIEGEELAELFKEITPETISGKPSPAILQTTAVDKNVPSASSGKPASAISPFPAT